MSGKSLDKSALARKVGGIWKERKDISDIDGLIRKLRKGKRMQRLGFVRHFA